MGTVGRWSVVTGLGKEGRGESVDHAVVGQWQYCRAEIQRAVATQNQWILLAPEFMLCASFCTRGSGLELG